LLLTAVENGDTDFFLPHPSESVDRFINDDPTLFLEDFTTTEDMIALFEENMAIVNAAFIGTPFRFNYAGSASTTVVISAEWTNGVAEVDAEISAFAGSNDLTVLDVFLGLNVFAPDPGSNSITLGLASPAGAQRNGAGGKCITSNLLRNPSSMFSHPRVHSLFFYRTQMAYS
jgi:hypothetical protein